MPDKPCREWIMEPPTPGVQCELSEGHAGDHRAVPEGMLLPVVWNEDDERLRFVGA
jgi:hypothetical protein